MEIENRRKSVRVKKGIGEKKGSWSNQSKELRVVWTKKTIDLYSILFLRLKLLHILIKAQKSVWRPTYRPNNVTSSKHVNQKKGIRNYTTEMSCSFSFAFSLPLPSLSPPNKLKTHHHFFISSQQKDKKQVPRVFYEFFRFLDQESNIILTYLLWQACVSINQNKFQEPGAKILGLAIQLGGVFTAVGYIFLSFIIEEYVFALN